MRLADRARRLARACRIPIRRPQSARSVDLIIADIMRKLHAMPASPAAQAIIDQLNALPTAIDAVISSTVSTEVATAEAAKDAAAATTAAQTADDFNELAASSASLVAKYAAPAPAEAPAQ